MEKTSRRDLLRTATAGGVAAAAGLGALIRSERTVGAASQDGHGEHRPISGNHAHVTVAFGQWDADPDNLFDRQPVNSDRTRNIHQQLPFEAVIEEGGAVSFIISAGT